MTGYGENDRDYWVKDDEKARRYRRNRRFIKPIDIEAVPPPQQPVQAPTPARPTSRIDSRSFADVASQPATPETTPRPLRSVMTGPRCGERIRKKVVFKDYV